jgi:hypothetical protein
VIVPVRWWIGVNSVECVDMASFPDIGFVLVRNGHAVTRTSRQHANG